MVFLYIFFTTLMFNFFQKKKIEIRYRLETRVDKPEKTAQGELRLGLQFVGAAATDAEQV